MKITTEMPDDLYRRVKARAAREGRTVREVTEELYRSWLKEPASGVEPDKGRRGLERWLTEARALVERAGATGPTATELLEEGRRRLDDR